MIEMFCNSCARKFTCKLILALLILISITNPLKAQHKGVIDESSTKEEIIATIPANFSNRIALVVGNADYNPGKLKNPVKDADAVAEVLRQSGFKVIRHTNTNLEDLKQVIDEYGDSIKHNPGVSLFYYSGHGIQFDAKNYMLPLNAQLQKANDVAEQTVAINSVFKKMKQVKGGLNIILLDACRNNAFTDVVKTKSGLSSIDKAPENTYIFYATSPDEVALDGEGDNSPFTTSFVKAIRNDKDSVEMFQVVKNVIRDVKKETNGKQVPWIVGSPEVDFYFKAPLVFKSDLYILSIGISKYQFIPKLKLAAKDALDVGDILKLSMGQNFDGVYITTLLDEEATARNIQLALQEIRAKVTGRDFIIVYFAGQGDENRSEYYMLPVDVEADKAAYSSDAISFDFLMKSLSDMPCKSMFMNDACFMGDSKNLHSVYNKYSKPENGIILFLAGSPGELVMEDFRWGNGLFVAAIKSALADSSMVSEPLTLRRLQYAVQDKMDLLTGDRKLQHPLMIIPPGMPVKLPLRQLPAHFAPRKPESQLEIRSR